MLRIVPSFTAAKPPTLLVALIWIPVTPLSSNVPELIRATKPPTFKIDAVPVVKLLTVESLIIVPFSITPAIPPRFVIVPLTSASAYTISTFVIVDTLFVLDEVIDPAKPPTSVTFPLIVTSVMVKSLTVLLSIIENRPKLLFVPVVKLKPLIV